MKSDAPNGSQSGNLPLRPVLLDFLEAFGRQKQLPRPKSERPPKPRNARNSKAHLGGFRQLWTKNCPLAIAIRQSAQTLFIQPLLSAPLGLARSPV